MPRRRGYGSKFRAIKNEIEKAFPGQTNVTGEATPGATGYLEVQVVGGALLHSKKNGMGYVDTPDKMQHMCVATSWALPGAALTLTVACARCALTRAPRIVPRSLDGVKAALASA